jgi:hypothetical protein
MARCARITAATALLAALAGSAQATTYYVSSSSGNDGNSGSSPATAWRSLQRVEQAATGTLQPGDAVLLAADDVFLQDSTVFLSGLSGTTQSPITFSAYATAAGAQERPLILRNTTANPYNAVMEIRNASGITIDGLAFAGAEQGVVFSYPAPGAGGSSYEGVIIANCWFNHISGANYTNNTGSWWGAAIAFGAYGAGVTVYNTSITHNVLTDSDTFYINSFGPLTRPYMSGVTVAFNTLTRASYNTLFMDTTNRFLVQGNVFMRNTPAALFVAGTTDIIMGTLDSSCALLGNEIGWRGEFSPGGPDGCAIDFETQADGVEVMGNYIHNSWGSGIMVLGHSTTSTNLVIAGNIMLDNGCNQTAADRGGMAFMHLNSSGVVSNNTFTTCPGVPLFNEVVNGALQGWTFSNNTIDGPTSPVVVAATPAVDATVAPDGSSISVTASCTTPGAVLRYTVDGSRPTAESLAFPAAGVLQLGPRTVAVNVKAFAPPMVESATNGGVFSPVPGAAQRVYFTAPAS